VFDALALKAPLASPTFTGTPTAPTPAQGDNDTSIATTAFVNTEIASDAPVGLARVAATGTVISFAVPQKYGSVATPETGNITYSTTGLVLGMYQMLLHNHSSTPTMPSEFVIVWGGYVVNVLNTIRMEVIESNYIEVTISQEL
jgi:hypothetical protein